MMICDADHDDDNDNEASLVAQSLQDCHLEIETGVSPALHLPSLTQSLVFIAACTHACTTTIFKNIINPNRRTIAARR